MSRIVVTGIGPVTPAGVGRESFGAAVRGGSSAPPEFRVHPIELDGLHPKARAFRRVADSTRLLLAAVALALRDAQTDPGSWDPERAGLIVCMTHGVLSLSTRFHAGLVQDGPSGASPLHFSESVLNAPAGNAAIAFGIRGPVHTLSGEETVGVQAIDLASRLLRSGSIDICVVAGSEERSEVVEGGWARYDRAASLRRNPEDPPPAQAEGAGALIVETEEHAARRGTAAKAILPGWACDRAPGVPQEEAVRRATLAAVRAAGLSPQGIGYILVPTGRDRSAVARAAASLCRDPASPRMVDPQAILGNPASAAVLLEIALLEVLLSGPGRRTGSNGLVLARGAEGTVAAVVVSVSDGRRREENP